MSMYLKFRIGKDKRKLVPINGFELNDADSNNPQWIQGRQNEDGGRQVFVDLEDEAGSPVNLTGANAIFKGVLPGGEYKIWDHKHSTIIDAQAGRFRYTFPKRAMAIAGSYKQAFFEVYREGSKLATLEFNFEVLADLVEENIIPSDYITPFEDLYGKLKDYIAKANGDFDAAMAQWKKDVADLISDMNADVGTINLTISEIKTQLAGLENKILEDGLLTKADLDKYLADFSQKFIDLENDVKKSLGDFQKGNPLATYFEDEINEVGGPIPAYYQNRLNQFNSIPKDNFNVGFITDAHLQLDNYAPNSTAHYAYIAAASRRARLDAIIAGGDNTNGWWEKNQKLVETRHATSTLFNRTAAGTDVFFQMGNHDTGINQNGHNTPDTCLSESEIKAMYHTADLMYGEVRDGDSLYGYKDYPDKKVRLIWLNSFDLPYELNEDGTFKYDFLRQPSYRNQQLTWLAEKALKMANKDWQVMVFTHAPLPDTFGVIPTEFNSDVLIGILNAFQNGIAYSIKDTTREMPVDINVDFSTQGTGVLIGLFTGHVHEDGQMLYSNINCVETACSLCYSGDSQRARGTETEDCWDIFSIDTVNRKIHAYRFGYGTDRNFGY